MIPVDYRTPHASGYNNGIQYMVTKAGQFTASNASMISVPDDGKTYFVAARINEQAMRVAAAKEKAKTDARRAEYEKNNPSKEYLARQEQRKQIDQQIAAIQIKIPPLEAAEKAIGTTDTKEKRDEANKIFQQRMGLVNDIFRLQQQEWQIDSQDQTEIDAYFNSKH